MPDFSLGAIPHIAEAAERDRAQLAAHDAALRSKFSRLPTEGLVARSEDLRIAASSEASAERRLRDLQERIERVQLQIERYDAQRERAREVKRRFRKDELARIDHAEARSQERLSGLEVKARELIVPSGSARQELAVADRGLAERRELAITAARIAPAAYITKELGGEAERSDETLGLGQYASRARDLGRSQGLGRQLPAKIASVDDMEYLVCIPPVASVAGCEARLGGPQRFKGPLPVFRLVNLAE